MNAIFVEIPYFANIFHREKVGNVSGLIGF